MDVGCNQRFRQKGSCVARAGSALLLTLLLLLAAAVAAQAAPLGRRAVSKQRSSSGSHRARSTSKKAKKKRPTVLRVGEFNGVKGEYTSIQAAINAAEEGDWILIGPGDYKQTETQKIETKYGDGVAGADILVTKPNIHIRGMNRNEVMIDGTKPGSPECSSAKADQIFGPEEEGGWRGNNGVVVYKANGVTLQNFSTCNFLGYNHGGDSVWFDGGGSSGHQNIGSWWGEYLTSTSTYWEGREKPSDEYGIYASNTYGPGYFTNTYANNMSDSSYYIGACPNCNVIINKGHAEDSDLGYSGSNSGGHLIIENSEFKNNEEGVATQSQNNDDAPSPQEGLCPKGEENKYESKGELPSGALAHAQRKNICWILYHNKIIDNNNGATPTNSGAPGLVGTGATIAGGRNDLVADNAFEGNDAWGILILPYPGVNETPENQGGSYEIPKEDYCRGGVGEEVDEKYECLYEPSANEVEGNVFADNGSFGNPSNGDIGEVADPSAETTNDCWHENVDAAQLEDEPTSEPKAIQKTHGTCGGVNTGGEPASSVLTAQAACDSQLLAECPSVPGEDYPRTSEVKMPTPPQEAGMANPCEGLPKAPKDRWCRDGHPIKYKHWG
jgi:hypothetical protein